MRRVLALSICIAVGFGAATFTGALAGDSAREPGAGASALRGLVDLSHPFNEDTIYWPTATRFTLTKVAEGETEGGWYYAANDFAAAEHGGTHLDSPIHFARGGDKTDEIPLRRLVGGAVVVSVVPRALADRDYLISAADFEAWERRNGRIPRRAIVLLRTGFDRYWPDAERYLGTAERGEAAVPKLHFPGLSEAGARWLVRERRVKAVGIDTASIDRGQSTDFMSHRVLGAANVPVFENLARLGRLPRRGFGVVALPMKIEGGSGGPLRVIAVQRGF
jgi:kynurenine formamidase